MILNLVELAPEQDPLCLVAAAASVASRGLVASGVAVGSPHGKSLGVAA
jgi:hypothetical protein